MTAKKKTSKLLEPKKAAVSHLAHLSPTEQLDDEAYATRRYSPNRTRGSKQSRLSTTKSKG